MEPKRGQSPFSELLDPALSRFTVDGTTAGNIRMNGNVLEVREPDGWLKSKERFADFELVCEFRYLSDDADSGIFLRTLAASSFRRGWPNESYQIQIRNPLGPSAYPPVGALFRHGMAHGETRYDEALARASSRPTGEWQELLARAIGDELQVALNGVEICLARGLAEQPGHIGLQGETGVLEFRSLRLRSLSGMVPSAELRRPDTDT